MDLLILCFNVECYAGYHGWACIRESADVRRPVQSESNGDVLGWTGFFCRLWTRRGLEYGSGIGKRVTDDCALRLCRACGDDSIRGVEGDLPSRVRACFALPSPISRTSTVHPFCVSWSQVPIITFDFDEINIDLGLACLPVPAVPATLDIDDDQVLAGVDRATEKCVNGPRVTNMIHRLVSEFEFRSLRGGSHLLGSRV